MSKSKLKVSGVGRLRATLADKRRKAKDRSVIVGYTAKYAIYVHEMVGANFKAAGTQAKFLEEPARRFRGVLGKIIAHEHRTNGSLARGLKIAGLRLQRESQKVCPVDTGNLKGSAFTRSEGSFK